MKGCVRWGVLLIAGVAYPALESCGGRPPEAETPLAEALAPVTGGADGAEVDVDPRIELMAVVQLLAGYPVLTSLETPYRADATAYFAPQAGNPAVALFDSLSSEGFSFDAVPKAFMWMTEVPDLHLMDSVPEDVEERAGGRDALKRFTGALRDFVDASDFGAFFRTHAGTYQAMVDAAQPAVTAAIAQLADYTGASFPDARVVLSPLLHDGGFAMRGGHPAVQAFIGPVGVSDGFPDFGTNERLGPLVWHEFAHTVVNPLTEQAAALVDSLEVTDEGFRSDMRRQAYSDWRTIVNESIIRAIEVRLATRVLGPEAGAKTQARQVERGFVHVPRLAEVLRTYEADRRRFPTFAAFYPRLLDVFR